MEISQNKIWKIGLKDILKNKKDNIKDKVREIIRIDNINKTKIEKVAQENKKNVNILEDCKKFCQKYSNKDFESYSVDKLKLICDEGNGLLDTYFITDSKEDTQSIVRLEYIVMNANYSLNIKQIESARRRNIELSDKIRKTMHRAAKLEKESKNRARQIEDVKNEQKSIITTIISIVLAISIIPTAVAGIQNIDSNYILPFLSSIILFGIIMISFTYSLYLERFRKRIFIFLILLIIICGCFWYMAFNFDISVTPKQNQGNNNNIQNIIEDQ